LVKCKIMFIDSARITVKAGDGGRGCNSFYRNRLKRKRIPNGGDGGKGGDVILRADKNLHTLLDFKYNRYFRAKNGSPGLSNNKKGKEGEDLLIKVPVGTVVKDAGDGTVLRDLDRDNEQLIVAKGGLEGKGNSSRRPATEGVRGEKRELLLELRFIADVGLLGLPNAGKSTLICAVSNAKSSIADYPFTTKAPVLGRVEREEFSFLIADLPGLIKDSHLGKGMGFRFLKHVEKTKILLHVIDMAQTHGGDAVNDYYTLVDEINFYSRELAEKKRIVVANKMDLEGAEENLRRFSSKVKEKIFAISALRRIGLEELIDALGKELQKNRS